MKTKKSLKTQEQALFLKSLPPSEAKKIPPKPKPSWIRMRPPSGERFHWIRTHLRDRTLFTVCEEAHCPNLSECWAQGTATFLLGGDTCTRACRFCAVKTARRPPALDPNEKNKVSEMVAQMKLRYVVLTSVDRDDLEDGAAAHFAHVVETIKMRTPDVLVETLMPDFQGNATCVATVLQSGINVFAHNLETVERLQKRVRDPRASYQQSLSVLQIARDWVKKQKRMIFIKSSLMVGLGETMSEILQAAQDLNEAGVQLLTIGQYLRPSRAHLPVEKFYTPEEFCVLKKEIKTLGFLYVFSGPLVRSSYRALEVFLSTHMQSQKEGV